jgi:hypothetical protein
VEISGSELNPRKVVAMELPLISETDYILRSLEHYSLIADP